MRERRLPPPLSPLLLPTPHPASACMRAVNSSQAGIGSSAEEGRLQSAGTCPVHLPAPAPAAATLFASSSFSLLILLLPCFIPFGTAFPPCCSVVVLFLQPLPGLWEVPLLRRLRCQLVQVVVVSMLAPLRQQPGVVKLGLLVVGSKVVDELQWGERGREGSSEGTGKVKAHATASLHSLLPMAQFCTALKSLQTQDC